MIAVPDLKGMLNLVMPFHLEPPFLMYKMTLHYTTTCIMNNLKYKLPLTCKPWFCWQLIPDPPQFHIYLPHGLCLTRPQQ